MESDWSNLPDEILLEIFKKLNVSDIINASMSKKSWHAVATDNGIWKDRCLNLRQELFLVLHRNVVTLPRWLLVNSNLDFFRRPPKNFYFVEFMLIWSKFPHVWIRNGKTSDVKCIRFEPNDHIIDNEWNVFPEYFYTNWKEYFVLENIGTLWINNNNTIKRYTITEPLDFKVSFSGARLRIDPVKKIFVKSTNNGQNVIVLRNDALQDKLEMIINTLTAAVPNPVTSMLLILCTFLVNDHDLFVSLVSRDSMSPRRLLETIRLLRERIDVYEFRTVHTTLITTAFTIITQIGVSLLPKLVVEARVQAQILFGVDLFGFDVATPPTFTMNGVIFITKDDVPECYRLTDNTKPPVWIHNMDFDGVQYDMLGDSICSTCMQVNSNTMYKISGHEDMGKFCSSECAIKQWNL